MPSQFRTRRRLRLPFVVTVVMGLLAACATEPVSPAGPNTLSTAAAVDEGGGVAPSCIEGCLDPDPAPAAPGIYLAGNALSLEGCFILGQPDADADGLSDRCESQLAVEFAPEMSFYLYDQVERETRWFAHPLPSGSIRLGYLLGYYYDVGTISGSRSRCELLLTLPPLEFFVEMIFGGQAETCRGHLGDSEWVALDVRWNPVTRHWVLQTAMLSAHESVGVFTAGSDEYPTGLVYPTHAGRHPRVWVADGKHANYPGDAACDAGGTRGSDNCINSPRYLHRVNVMAAGGNVGSWLAPLVDCVTSINPSHPAILWGPGYTRSECYFTNQRFYGWYPGPGESSRGYAEVLQQVMPVETGSGLP
jgi:hypothetical protein